MCGAFRGPEFRPRAPLLHPISTCLFLSNTSAPPTYSFISSLLLSFIFSTDIYWAQNQRGQLDWSQAKFRYFLGRKKSRNKQHRRLRKTDRQGALDSWAKLLFWKSRWKSKVTSGWSISYGRSRRQAEVEGRKPHLELRVHCFANFPCMGGQKKEIKLCLNVRKIFTLSLSWSVCAKATEMKSQ